jgi:GT2 family glycosyltransferase
MINMSRLQTKKEPKVTIVIVNWNRKKLLKVCLSSIEKTTEYSNYSIIVVDNGSSDGSVNLVESKFPSVNLVTLKKNMGFAVGNNIGIVKALKNDTDYVLLLNNDTLIIQSTWLERIVETAEENEKIGIVGCKLIYPNGKVQHVGSRLDSEGLHWINPRVLGRFPKVFDVDTVLGACFLIKRKVIDTIGFLDEGFSPFQHEESDFCLRTQKAGYRVCTTLSVKVVHLLGGSNTLNYFDFTDRKNQIRLSLLNFSAGWFVRHSVYEVRTFASCFFERKSVFQKRFLFRLEIRKDWRIRIGAYCYAWLFNARNLREILAKRRNRTGKILPTTGSFIDYYGSVPQN